MNIVNVVQKSPEWYAIRANRFTASEATAMIGISKHMTRTALLHEKATGIIEDPSRFEQKLFDNGHAAEKSARSIVEARLGVELFPTTAILEVDGIPLLASYDGVSMDETIVWENKLKNEGNIDLLAAIDDEHWPQLEQQALIAGTDSVYFTVSDGTEDGTRGVYYASRPERRAKLIAGWKQFIEDLKSYVPQEAAPVVVGKAPETLPALRIEVTGAVTASNLAEFRAKALAVIGGIKTELQTDEDFANAEQTVKWCGDVEARLEAAKQHALSQTATIDELFRTIDQIKSDARAKRLELEKLVKTRKEAIRTEIVSSAQVALTAHVQALNQRLGKSYMPSQDTTRFAAVIKGLKTLSSLRNAVATELANAKIEASAIADRIEANMKTLRELASSHVFLFADTSQLVLKSNDDLTALIKSRIADYDAEKKRKEAEQPPAPTTGASPTVPPAPASPAPVAAAAPAQPHIVDQYLATIKETPKTKAMVRMHLIAFVEFTTSKMQDGPRRAAV